MSCTGFNCRQLSFQLPTCGLHSRFCRFCVQSYTLVPYYQIPLEISSSSLLCFAAFDDLTVESSTDVLAPLVDGRQYVSHPLA
jgi:hypothetical protein